MPINVHVLLWKISFEVSVTLTFEVKNLPLIKCVTHLCKIDFLKTIHK